MVIKYGLYEYNASGNPNAPEIKNHCHKLTTSHTVTMKGAYD